jgi:hypothetical protein
MQVTSEDQIGVTNMNYLSQHEEWLEHNGKGVVIDGLRYTIRVSVHHAIYPVQADMISVHAEPMSKQTDYYLKVKHQLGDDWSTDVLESDCTLTADLLTQCQGQQQPKSYQTS